IRLWEAWIRSGRPESGPPHASDHGVMLCDVNERLSEMESAIRKETGLSCWLYYDPAYYRPMMQARRDAVLAGQDPDKAAKECHQRYVDQHRRRHRKGPQIARGL